MDSRPSRSSPRKSTGGTGQNSQPHSPFKSTSTLPDLSHPSSSSHTAAVAPPSTWLPILESSNQLVLYNPTSHALTIAPPSLPPSQRPAALLAQGGEDDYDESIRLDESSFALQQRSSSSEIPFAHHHAHNGAAGPEGVGMPLCPFCARPLPPTFPTTVSGANGADAAVISRRAPNYFQFLEANFITQNRPQLLSGTLDEMALGSSTPLLSPSSPAPSMPSTPGVGDRARLRPKVVTSVSSGAGDSVPGTPQARFSRDSMAQGYFAAFFKEEKRLGMGANGSVYLCQHVLNGNYLGHFAVKKIAVGHSQEYLLRILREVRLLESLRHPNIISYHHSWLETTRFSSFGPSIPTLHVLMEWAEGGSLDDLIDARQGKRTIIAETASGTADDDANLSTRSARIRAFKAAKQSHASGSVNTNGTRQRSSSIGVHLLSPEEIKSFFNDIVSGLAFLHDRSILHLDLKLGNVLLTKDDDRLIQRAMLSDFGTSQDALQTSRVRSGNTGTVEYSAPEALAKDPVTGQLLQIDSKSDMWSLGIILHKLIFFRLPYPEIDPSDVNGIEREVLAYPGWKATADVISTCKRRGLPRATLLLLESLLNRNPRERPTSERVLFALKDSSSPELPSRLRHGESTVVVRRRSSSREKRSLSPLETLRLKRPSESPPASTGETRPSSPLISKIHSPTHGDLVDPLTNLLLPAPVRAYARLPRTRWRTLRTIILILKIISLSKVCERSHPVLWIQAAGVACAGLDVWQEGDEDGRGDLRISVGLVFMHIILLVAIRLASGRLCVV